MRNRLWSKKERKEGKGACKETWRQEAEKHRETKGESQRSQSKKNVQETSTEHITVVPMYFSYLSLFLSFSSLPSLFCLLSINSTLPPLPIANSFFLLPKTACPIVRLSHLVFNVKDALLDLVVDLVGCLNKSILHIAGRFGGRLHKEQSVVPRKLFTLLLCHRPLGVQVATGRQGMLLDAKVRSRTDRDRGMETDRHTQIDTGHGTVCDDLQETQYPFRPFPPAYVLLPISIMTMFGLECERASSSHVVRWWNVSRL